MNSLLPKESLRETPLRLTPGDFIKIPVTLSDSRRVYGAIEEITELLIILQETIGLILDLLLIIF